MCLPRNSDLVIWKKPGILCDVYSGRREMSKPFKVIDLFAGPGGLGEGFSSFCLDDNPRFKIAISIEKEASAHRTLKLRSVYRQFPKGSVPEAYYSFLRGELGRHPEDYLYKEPEIQDALQEAEREAQRITLGDDNTKLTHDRIKAAIGKDDCILIGGPPCQAYSIVGRARNYGDKEKKYSASEDHRNFLYKEYLKVIAQFQPLVFVMENVKGMLSAKIDGEFIFTSIRRDLQDPCRAVGLDPDAGRHRHKYKIFSFVPGQLNIDLDGNSEIAPKDFIIRSEKYGIPQARHRVILLGVREDLADNVSQDRLLRESEVPVTVKQAISDLPQLRSKLSKGGDSLERWRSSILGMPSHDLEMIENDLHVKKHIFSLYKKNIRGVRNSPESTGAEKGLRSSDKSAMPAHLREWYEDPRLDSFVTNHESRGHIEGDLFRYLYYSTYASVVGDSPKSHNLPEALWPNHKNFHSGNFADRFRVQLADRPGTTVTSHISKDGHYFIHYDPVQCRSLTVREAARLQTFPDNYYFVGNRTEQYVQVGNAVPPYLARQLAKVVYEIINETGT